MLESPSDESVVRWGNEGDSFVVLEVRAQSGFGWKLFLTAPAEREIHEAHPPKTLQT
jgi:osomolarity two-component system response regulator SKN7